MDVGQVEFSVSSKTLESVLASAKELQGILNGIDGRSYGGKGGGHNVVNRRPKTHQKALRMVANDEKKYAIQQHERQQKEERDEAKHQDKIAKMNIKTGNLKVNERLKTAKRIARIDREQAARDNAIAKNNIRLGNLRLKERFKTAKRMQKLDAEERKKEQDALKAQEEALGEQIKARGEFQRRTQTQIVNIGAQMQTLGATLQRVTSPFADVYRGLLYGVGYRALGMVTESISGAFSRYDTIQTYSKVLKNLGIDATKKFSVAGEEATDVYHNLENAVLGLPTGIDEIIESMRRYAGATGEAERATKLAIAANNAYIAGHMGEREKLFTERQLVALAGGAELSTNQWDSLRRNAPLAMKVVAKEMKMSVQEMVDSLKKGKISGQEFLDVFIKAGTEGKIKEAATVMKQTWDAVAQNVRNRMNAMGEGILHSLDEVFKKIDGRNFLQHVLGVDKKGNYIGGGLRGVIDDMAQSARDWIKANPDKILKFFDNLQKIDWKGILGGFAEVGIMLGNFYSGLAKTFGSANLVKWMVGINIVGKILQNAGGLIKGTAWLSSRALTSMFFGGGGKHSAGKLGQFFSGLAGAGKSAESMALSWEGVVSKAVTIAAIPAVAWSLREVALAFQEFNKVDLSLELVGKIQVAGLILAEFAGLATLFGSLLAEGHLGVLTTAGAAIGTAEIAGISKTMRWLGEGLNAIAEAKLPDSYKIKKVMSAVREIEKYFKARNPFEAIGRIADSITKSTEFKSIKSLGSAFTGISNVAGTDLPKHWRKKVKKRMSGMLDILQTFEETFLEWEEKGEAKKGKPNRNGGYATRTQSMTSKLQVLADSTKAVSSVFTDMVSIVDNAKDLNTKLNKISNKMPPNVTKGEKGTSLFDNVRKNLRSMVDGIYSLLSDEDELGNGTLEKLQSISTTFSAIDLENVNKQIGFVPKIIEKMLKINQQFAAQTRGLINTNGTASFSGIADKLSPLFKEIGKLPDLIPENIGEFKGIKTINKALDNIKTTVKKLTDMSSIDTSGINLGNIKETAGKLKEALGSFEDVGDKNIKISFKADITGQDEVKKDVKKEIDKLRDEIERMDALIEKEVDVDLETGTVSGFWAVVNWIKNKIRKIKDEIAGVDGTVTKHIDTNLTYGGHGHATPQYTGGRTGKKIQYRANGGSIFQPRGTDTIPTMLTEGEYVINHMASNAIGYDVLQKLNHLDIPGAIRGLYSRASTNTVNNTKNANVTVNNYNAPDVGFAKASRWVQQL